MYDPTTVVIDKWIFDHRGRLATGGAFAWCLLPFVGWASCAGAQGLALGVRVQQRGVDRKHLTDNLVDAGVTGSSAGLLGGTSSGGEEAIGGGYARFFYRLHTGLADFFNSTFGG